MPRKRPSRSLRKLFIRTIRSLSPRLQVLLLLFLGALLGAFLTSLFQYLYIHPLNIPFYSSPTSNLTPPPPSLYITPHDHCANPRSPCFIFVFATGRSGTQHLSRVLKSHSHHAKKAYITHEEEHLSARTKIIVDRHYRRLASLPTEKDFNASALEYVKHTKLPFYRALLSRAAAIRLVYTGHVPMAFGMGPSLIQALPENSLRVLRLRRDRVATALSLMALGPEEEDPWGKPGGEEQISPQLKGPLLTSTQNRRWFPKPTDSMVRLQVAQTVWGRFNRFQKWLWYVDDIECRWQALKLGYQGKFSYMEEGLESLNVMDGGAGWRRLAEFVGVDINWDKVGQRDNSIQYKMKTKINVTESTLRKWDIEYRRSVGPCQLTSKHAYGWHFYSRHPYS